MAEHDAGAGSGAYKKLAAVLQAQGRDPIYTYDHQDDRRCRSCLSANAK
jgi:hypothetical protein